MRWIMFSLLATAAIAVSPVTSRADDKPKMKDKGQSSGQSIDLNKLPPDLQKQVLKALESNKGKPEKDNFDGKQGDGAKGQAKPAQAGGKHVPPGLARKKGQQGKGQQAMGNAGKKDGKQAQAKGVELPPGLRNKSPNHPGVAAFLKAQSEQKKAAPTEKPMPKGKGKN